MSGPWRPRGSSLGYYLQCSYRAAFDRALAEGLEIFDEAALAIIEAAKASSPYADLGTVIHYHTQVRLGAVFHKQTAEAAAPTEEQILNAMGLFKGKRELLMEQVDRAAALGAAAIGPGKWMAELKVRRPWVTGHVDLIDPVAGVLVDIKTTSRPPHYTHLSPTHLAQTLAYTIAAEEEKLTAPITLVRVVYVDSLKGQWWTQAEYNPQSAPMLEYREILKASAKALQKKSLYTTATPNFASCEWCPYVSMCRDRYAVPRGQVHTMPTVALKATNPLKIKE
jgi:CRISPR/Cas system-associated exonuclease Cas4 (RecB family)